MSGMNKTSEKQDYRYYPAYSILEASGYLNVPQSTVRYWSVGRRDQAGLLHVAQPSGPTLLSFINLVELHVLSGIRLKHGVSLPHIRSAMQFVARKYDLKHPLVEQSFETDGIDLFVEKFGQLINVSREGQIGITDILRSALKRVERDDAGLPIRLFPYTRSIKDDSPSIVVIDPRLSGGRPTMANSGVAVQVIAERYKAGDSITALARDYDRTPEEIEEAIRAELYQAA
jgi:uncharacterized protein (DUF433 family)